MRAGPRTIIVLSLAAAAVIASGPFRPAYAPHVPGHTAPTQAPNVRAMAAMLGPALHGAPVAPLGGQHTPQTVHPPQPQQHQVPGQPQAAAAAAAHAGPGPAPNAAQHQIVYGQLPPAPLPQPHQPGAPQQHQPGAPQHPPVAAPLQPAGAHPAGVIPLAGVLPHPTAAPHPGPNLHPFTGQPMPAHHQYIPSFLRGG